MAGLGTPRTPRKNVSTRAAGGDLSTPSRWKVLIAYFQISQGERRLPRGGMAKLKNRFPSYNLTPRMVQRLVADYRSQESVALSEDVDLSRKRRHCGGSNLKLTKELAQKLIEINDRSWGRLSCKKLAGELRKQGFDVSKDSVRRWCAALGATRRRCYVKPACPKLYQKWRQPQVMFLALTAKLRPEYSFDGKVGIWSFTRL